VKTGGDREVLRVLVQVLRALRNWDQSEMAAAAGVDGAAISRYEGGGRTPRRTTLERLAAAVGLPLLAVETILVPAIRQALALLPAGGGGEVPPGAAVAGGKNGQGSDGKLATALYDAAVGGLEIASAELDRLQAAKERTATLPCAADRLEGAKCWERLEPCKAQERRWLVERLAEFQLWGLADRLWSESVQAAADDAWAALELAQLGLRVAELSRGEERWKKLLQGLGRGFVGNALRVQGELRAAEVELAAARELLKQGEGGDLNGVLAAWRLDDLEASLRRELRDYQGALNLLDRAESAAPRESRGRILLKRASILEQAGDLAEAAAALREAAPLIEETGDERLRWVADFNTTAILCRLERHGEAEARLPGLRALSVALGNQLDMLRVAWLSGRVAAGLARKEEARAAFERVLDEFAQRWIGFDAALVGLELAVLHLEAGRTAEVRELAASMAWVLAQQDIEQEALAALRLFFAAAQRERATVEQAQAVLAALKASGGRDQRRSNGRETAGR
jgi:transcriptional regulator with XRE-family HTH domain